MIKDNSSNYIVPDLLEPGLKLVFCGTAPSASSAQKKAYYANPGNRFWRVLQEIGITDRLFCPNEYPKLLHRGVGMTDLCKTVSGNDDELPHHAIEPHSVREKILRHQPKLVAFTSKHGASLFFGRRIEYGLQAEQLGDSRFFVLCSTSGRARRFWRQELWDELGKLYQAA